MKKKSVYYLSAIITIGIISTFALFSFAGSYAQKPKTGKVENFTLKDYNGKAHSLNDYKKSKAIVLMFISTECPVSNAYNKRMAQLPEKYSGKNVTFLGINSNKQESIEEIKAHSKKNKLEFAVLKDEKNIIADKLGATVTPEIYVINSDFEILYHGRIDDSRNESNVERKDLQNALDEILINKKVSNTETKAFGCTIKRVDA